MHNFSASEPGCRKQPWMHLLHYTPCLAHSWSLTNTIFYSVFFFYLEVILSKAPPLFFFGVFFQPAFLFHSLHTRLVIPPAYYY